MPGTFCMIRCAQEVLRVEGRHEERPGVTAIEVATTTLKNESKSKHHLKLDTKTQMRIRPTLLESMP